MVRLPYPPRPGQAELQACIEATQRDAAHLVTEAATGTGKTVTALVASLTTAASDGRRLVWATRTNSQQTQIVREHHALIEDGQDPGLLVPLMGRRHYCPLLRSDARFRDGTPEELGRLCRDAKRKAAQQVQGGAAVAGACPFYAKLLKDGPGPVEALLRSGGLDGADLAERVERAGSCTYEALKLLLPQAKAVVVPYVFLLDDALRARLWQWMGVGADEVHLVVDEAHHLPDAAREHHSLRLSVAALERAQREAEEYKDPILEGTTLATTLFDALLRAMQSLREEYVHDDGDGLIPPGALEETLLPALRLPSPALLRLAADAERWGEVIREDRRAKGRLPRSHIGAVGTFLRLWWQAREAPYVQLATSGDNPALEMVLLDPAPVLSWLGEAWSSTHMSGTLAPLDEYRDLAGLAPERTRLAAFASPFPPDHLQVWGLEGVSRRFEAVERDPAMVGRQQEAARQLLAHWPSKVGIFFPSHEMLADYLEEGLLHGTGRVPFVERAAMTSSELVRVAREFKAAPSPSVLVGVLGGRLSEGLDFPGETMEAMLIFGIPYPRPSARSQALIHYFDAKCGRGWMVAVHNPVARVLRQAIGRLIRGPGDRATAVILDERAVRFRPQVPRLRMAATVATIQAGPAPAPQPYETALHLSRKGPPGSP